MVAPREPTVRFHSPMPAGYIFVPKGNIYITRHSRSLTHASKRTVYLVKSPKNKIYGIRVPREIHEQVLSQHNATKSQRAAAVHQKDNALRSKVKDQILKSFPRIPDSKTVDQILEHTLTKRSGRVGRCQDLPIDKMTDLAVRAHIRHCETGYEDLLKRGQSRDEARKEVKYAVDDVLERWSGVPRDRRRGGSTLSDSTDLQSNGSVVGNNLEAKDKRAVRLGRARKETRSTTANDLRASRKKRAGKNADQRGKRARRGRRP